jgi:hypothetical protein
MRHRDLRPPLVVPQVHSSGIRLTGKSLLAAFLAQLNLTVYLACVLVDATTHTELAAIHVVSLADTFKKLDYGIPY